MNILAGKRILLGITGSIAAYKGAELASRLTQSGALVDVILTAAAEKFVSPLTFQSVTGRKAYTDADLWGGEGHVTHIGLGRAGDLIIVAPASATTLARLANGLSENLLSVTALASHCPLVLVPAMDAGMYSHPATQANVKVLSERGALIVGPASGHLASGLVGVGRMEETSVIIGAARYVLGKNGILAGQKLVITAGGTREAIDPVRTITNHSSGKQGYALAQAAIDQGADVTLITSAPLTAPYGCRVITVESAAQMHDAVMAEIKSAAGLIMSAAVADFKPRSSSTEKIKKEAGLPVIELEPTVDILKAVSALRGQLPGLKCVVGFAAESEELLTNARAKLRRKNLDLIVANDISAHDAGFGVETNRVMLVKKDDSAEALPLMTKDEVAEEVIRQVAAFFA
jgi:phosphopantothenoylcysteine decarboxylase/phosphopantothenate--cysteine ligase